MSASVSVTKAPDFSDVALPHLPSVARVARALARNEPDADDLVQETFLRALRSWHTFIPGSDCRLWLVTICRHAHYAQHRRAKVVTAVENEQLEALAAVRVHKAAVAKGLGDMFTTMDLGPAITEAIARLEPPFRDVAVLCDVEGFSYEEIAELLRIPIGTVRSRLFRARRQLQEALVEYARDAGFAPPLTQDTASVRRSTP